jgi:hypothetical protein
MARKARRAAKAAPETKSVINRDYFERYKAHGGSCGDEIASKLKEVTASEDGTCDLDKVERIAKANNIWKDEHRKLNPGMVRMVVGNSLRALARKGTAIK